MSWRFSEVVKDLESANEFIKLNKIPKGKYELVIIWDEDYSDE